MPSKDQVLALVRRGYGYPEIGHELGIPPGLAYLIATGLPADGGDTVTHRQRERPGVLPSHTQRLVNDRDQNPLSSDGVREWMRGRAREDAGLRAAGSRS